VLFDYMIDFNELRYGFEIVMCDFLDVDVELCGVLLT